MQERDTFKAFKIIELSFVLLQKCFSADGDKVIFQLVLWKRVEQPQKKLFFSPPTPTLPIILTACSSNIILAVCHLETDDPDNVTCPHL